MTLFSLDTPASKLNELHKITDKLGPTQRMPVLFLGHGSPMNAIEDNTFTRGFEKISKTLPKPTAILCISAHWETKGTYVTSMAHPQTIHDFGGFPQALFDVQYPAPGSPELAKQTSEIITSTDVHLTHEWGLDHGCWTVAKFLYPNADIPIVQMSIDYTQKASYHYDLAKQLAALRRKGVLIIGSGNTVHNLRQVVWGKMNDSEFALDWAASANEKIKKYILDGNHQDLINYDKQGIDFQMAVPTPEHYMPLIYTLALQEKDEAPVLFNDGFAGGSLNMLSVKIDKV